MSGRGGAGNGSAGGEGDQPDQYGVFGKVLARLVPQQVPQRFVSTSGRTSGRRSGAFARFGHVRSVGKQGTCPDRSAAFPSIPIRHSAHIYATVEPWGYRARRCTDDGAPALWRESDRRREKDGAGRSRGAGTAGWGGDSSRRYSSGVTFQDGWPRNTTTAGSRTLESPCPHNYATFATALRLHEHHRTGVRRDPIDVTVEPEQRSDR